MDSVCHVGSFQDLREQLSRLAVQMCDCWSQVHVAGDTSTGWRLLHELLRLEIAPSDTWAASVDTRCGCDVLRPLFRDAYAGASEDEQVDWKESSSASSQRQTAPGSWARGTASRFSPKGARRSSASLARRVVACTAPLRAIAETSLQWKWTLSLTELWIASPYHLSDLPRLRSSNCPLS